ncbi:MAG: peptidylprolyl isomerase [Ignavibacteriaceae bacterium]
MIKFKILVIIFSVFSVFCAIPKSKTDKTQFVATVGNNHITLQSFLDRYEDYLIWTGVQDNMQARFAVLNNMVNEILLRNYDDNSKVYNNPEYNKEIEGAKKETILAFLNDREVYAKINVTEDELREAYIRSKTKVAVRHLYAATLKEADNLYKLLEMGVSFKELAKQTFTDTTLKNNGGYLGYINWGETDPNFENVAYSLKVGETSKPVKTAEGYSIIKVEDRIQDPFMTEDEFVRMKHKLTRAVRISKKIPYEEAYLKKVFDKTKVKFNEKALAAVLDDLKKTNYDDVNIELNKSSNKIYKDCVKFEDKIYSQREIEKKIFEVPKYNLEMLTNVKRVKEAVLGLIMQDVLLGIAKDKGYDTTSYVTDTFNQLANNIYLNYKRNEILDLVPVADSEIVKYYKDNIGYYSKEKEMNVQEIVVDNDSLALALKKKIEGGGDFGRLAEEYSLRKWSAKNKGIMELSPVSNFGDMKDTLWDSPLGKILGPIKFDKYFGIFRVLSKKDSQPIDINLVKSQIIKAIKNEKGFPYMKKHLDALSKKATIKINDDLIKNYDINLAG